MPEPGIEPPSISLESYTLSTFHHGIRVWCPRADCTWHGTVDTRPITIADALDLAINHHAETGHG